MVTKAEAHLVVMYLTTDADHTDERTEFIRGSLEECGDDPTAQVQLMVNVNVRLANIIADIAHIYPETRNHLEAVRKRYVEIGLE